MKAVVKRDNEPRMSQWVMRGHLLELRASDGRNLSCLVEESMLHRHNQSLETNIASTPSRFLSAIIKLLTRAAGFFVYISIVEGVRTKE